MFVSASSRKYHDVTLLMLTIKDNSIYYFHLYLLIICDLLKMNPYLISRYTVRKRHGNSAVWHCGAIITIIVSKNKNYNTVDHIIIPLVL